LEVDVKNCGLVPHPQFFTPLNFVFEERHRKNGGIMKNIYTAIIKQDDGWWVGWIQEIPGVNCQERTKEELIESLRVT